MTRQGVIPIIKDFYNNVVSRKAYWMPVLFFTLLAYGFSLSRNTLSGDDMSQDVYLGIDGMMVKSLRWGMALWSYLFGLTGYSPYIYKFFGVVFFLFAAFFMCCIFYTISSREKTIVWAYTFFSAVFITFPLINEIWEYNGANAYVSGNLMIVMLAILLQICSKGKYWVSVIISGLLLTIVASSYETALFVYISVVLSLLFFKYCVLRVQDKKRCWFFEGIRFIPPLVISVILKLVIGYSLLALQHLSYEPKGAISINWGEFSIGRMVYLFITTVDKYFLLVNYFPICLFLISIILFIVILVKYSLTNKSLLPIALGFLLMISLFSISILRFSVMENRTAQTLNYFVAFVVFLTVYNVLSINKKIIKTIALGIVFLITTWQSSYLCQVLEWNNQRSENEIAVVRNLGVELSRDYKDKEIVFCGEYNLGNYLNERVTDDTGAFISSLFVVPAKSLSHHKEWYNLKHIETNVESNLSWSLGSTSIHPMKRLFSYCGYDLNIREIDQEEQTKYNTYAEKNNMKTFEIRDIGECVLVYLGPKETINE